MSLTEDYNKQLFYEQIKQKNEESLSELPKEFRFAIEPVSITSDIRNLVDEFLSLVPHNAWKCFPDNEKPEVTVDKDDTGYSINYFVKGHSYVNCYAQIMCDDKIPKSIQIQYNKSYVYYKGYKDYSWILQKKRIEKRINDEFNDAKKRMHDEFESFKNNYSALIKGYGDDLEQRFIRMNYYSSDGSNGYIVIFKDGNIYNWRVEGFTEEHISHSIVYDSYYPLKTVDNAKSFFLKQLTNFKNTII